MTGARLGEIPMTGGKLGDKQSERIVKMVSKHWTTYSTIYLHIDITLRHPSLICIYLFLYINSITLTNNCNTCIRQPLLAAEMYEVELKSWHYYTKMNQVGADIKTIFQPISPTEIMQE